MNLENQTIPFFKLNLESFDDVLKEINLEDEDIPRYSGNLIRNIDLSANSKLKKEIENFLAMIDGSDAQLARIKKHLLQTINTLQQTMIWQVVIGSWYPELTGQVVKGVADYIDTLYKENEHTLFHHCYPWSKEQVLNHLENTVVIDQVAGSLELPLFLSKSKIAMAKRPCVAGSIVIRGETAHFDLVTQSTNDHLMSVAIEHDINLGNALLACENLEQAQQRAYYKGAEAAHAAMGLWLQSKSPGRLPTLSLKNF